MQENLTHEQTRSISLVIFDLDGTLYDQKKLRRQLMKKFLCRIANLRMHLSDLRIIFYFRNLREQMKGRDSGILLEEQYKQCATRLGLSPERIKKTIETCMLQLPLQYIKQTRYKNIDACFTALRRREVRVAVYSDYPVKEKLEALELDADGLFCSMDEQIGQLKPSIKALRYICNEMECEPEHALYIGDREDTDGVGARQTGIRFMLVNRNEALKGIFYSRLIQLFDTNHDQHQK